MIARADKLSRTPAGRAAFTLKVRVAQTEVELPGSTVREVLALGQITEIPSANPANLGVILHDDRLVPVVDLACRLELAAAAANRRPALAVLVTDPDGSQVALAVDAVVGLSGGATHAQPAPGMTAG